MRRQKVNKDEPLNRLYTVRVEGQSVPSEFIFKQKGKSIRTLQKQPYLTAMKATSNKILFHLNAIVQCVEIDDDISLC